MDHLGYCAGRQSPTPMTKTLVCSAQAADLRLCLRLRLHSWRYKPIGPGPFWLQTSCWFHERGNVKAYRSAIGIGIDVDDIVLSFSWGAKMRMS